MTLGTRLLVLGGAALLAKGVLVFCLLVASVLAPEPPVVLGAVAETFIGLGIVLGDFIEPLTQHDRSPKK